jgi:iron complex outermembrane recepter protein
MIGKSLAAVVAISVGVPALAQEVRSYDIGEKDLAIALREFAEISGREVLFDSEAVRGRRSRAINASLPADAALRRLVEQTGLTFEIVEGSYIIRRQNSERAEGGESSGENDIVVTGTRVRGAPIASPTIRLDREAIRATGISNLGDAIRALPQSFGGGQNLGVGLNVPSENGANVGGGSSANLRGLGSDATLTLLNGHRLPYGAARQSVDISAIPFIAVDRIEVVADGASALYGSDAVAGVVNVILRREFNGLEGTAELGFSTDGGNFNQRYGSIAGTAWGDGGVFAAYEYNRSTAILAADRSYSALRSPGLTLFPGVTKHNVAASAHQRIGAAVNLSMDAIFNHRRSGFSYAPNAAGDPSVSRGFQSTTATSFAVAPRFTLDVVNDWRASATFGKDRVDYDAANFVGSAVTSSASGCYCNTGYSAEIGADGTLFALGGQAVKLAVGAGYRRNDYESFRGAGDRQNIDESQKIIFGYGELSAPLLTPEARSRFGYRLNLSAAARYERYAGIGGVLTPKFGLIYSPTADIDLKTSWGRSFRAPTFIQQFQFQQGIAVPATALGGTNLPPNALAVALLGGNRDLSPEKASSLSASVAWRPQFVRGLSVELAYFSTSYLDRIVNPVLVTGQALSNPVYREYVTLIPTLAQVEAAVNSVDLFIDGTGGAFDPQRVVAIVDSRNVNAGRQMIRGLDMLLDYRSAFLGGEIGLSANASYLESERRLTPSSGEQQLAGTLFNPPHFRARGTLSWRGDAVNAAATIGHIGGVEDFRTAPNVHIDGMTTLDINVRYTIGAGRQLSNVEIFASALNLLNAKPSPIRTTFVTDTPYDSTNYSPIGRYLSFGVTAKW